MPPITTSPSTPKRAKPYTKPRAPGSTDSSSFDADVKPGLSSPSHHGSSSDDDNHHSGKTSTPTRGKAGKGLSGDELQMLFDYAIKNGAPGSDKGWEGVVPGKTGMQCRNAWRRTVLPGVKKLFESRA